MLHFMISSSSRNGCGPFFVNVGLKTLTFSNTVRLAVVELDFRDGEGGGSDFVGFLDASERNMEFGLLELLVLLLLPDGSSAGFKDPRVPLDLRHNFFFF